MYEKLLKKLKLILAHPSFLLFTLIFQHVTPLNVGMIWSEVEKLRVGILARSAFSRVLKYNSSKK
jgi:hypothetical protein